MFLERLFRPGPAKAAGQRLYAGAVSRARAPNLYRQLGVPDTPDGRFEIYTLHVLLLLERLKGEGALAAAVSQAVFDAYLSGLDHGLRELAVGDLSVGKTMRKLGEAFYGRAKAWDVAVVGLPDRAPLEALVGRSVFAGVADSTAGALTGYLLDTRQRLADAPLARILDGEADWGA
jgi:cytochrome b pre-mRNA-processing protein 3